MRPMVDVTEFRSAYLAELDELLDMGGTHLLALERAAAAGQADPRAARELFRALHTIKGLSAMMGVEPIVELAHHMEGALRALQRGPPPPDAVDALFQGIRAVEQRARALAAGGAAQEPPAGLLEALESILGKAEPVARAAPAELTLPEEIEAKLGDAERAQLESGVAAGKRAVRVDFSPSPASAERGLTITSVRERLTAVAEIVKVIPLSRPQCEAAPAGLTFALLLLTTASAGDIADAAGLSPDDVTALLAPGSDAAEPEAFDLALDTPEPDAPPRRGAIRVELSRIDEAMDGLSALVVTRYRLERCAAELAAAGAPVRELSRLLGEQARELRELRGALLRVRMVPMREILDRLPLILRGLRRSTGKQVHFEIEGGGAELDKAVAERLLPAIIHLVRNAVDHGIEAPDERERLGKPRDGTIRIRCATMGSTWLSVSIADDGRGVDRAAVARCAGGPAARVRGEAELLDVLCAPGFSTRDEATTTSGRGMGLDIVRRVVAVDLGGELSLQSEPGAGATFTLRVPLTVAIIDAFAFQCADQRFVAPISMIEEIVDVAPASVSVGPGGMPLFERRGSAVPLVPLAGALFGLAEAAIDRGIRESGVPTRMDRPSKALVVCRRGEITAFGVDRLLGQREAVIRPLTDPLVKVAGVSGATDLGDGKPTLVLDLIALAGAVSGSRALARVEGA